MHRVLIAIAMLLVASVASATQRQRGVRLPQRFEIQPNASRLLWIAAHPDDEILAAPLLGELCLFRSMRCSFLVMTRGEAGECLLQSGCHPDLAAVRSGEMKQSAALFQADLVIWGLTDGTPGGAAAALARWSADAGGEEALLDSIAAEIRSANPDLIVTFDPSHGSTCHTDHQAAGLLTIRAADRAGVLDRLYVLENLVTIARDFSSVTFGTAIESATVVYDARERWPFFLAAAAIHASQFDERRLAVLSAIPPVDQLIRLLPIRGQTPLPLGSLCLR